MCIADYYLRSMRGAKEKLKGFAFAALLRYHSILMHYSYVYEFHPSDRPLVLQLGGSTAQPIIELANMEMYVSLSLCV